MWLVSRANKIIESLLKCSYSYISAHLSPRFLVLSMQEIKCLGPIVNPLLTMPFYRPQFIVFSFQKNAKTNLAMQYQAILTSLVVYNAYINIDHLQVLRNISCPSMLLHAWGFLAFNVLTYPQKSYPHLSIFNCYPLCRCNEVFFEAISGIIVLSCCN